MDLLDFVIYDGDASDPLQGFTDPSDTVLAAGAYALILDSSYAGTAYSIPAEVLLLTTDDKAIASGLSTSDPISLYDVGAASLIDAFSWPTDPGNGTSLERVDLDAGDEGSNWARSTCGASPGEVNCVAGSGG